MKKQRDRHEISDHVGEAEKTRDIGRGILLRWRTTYSRKTGCETRIVKCLTLGKRKKSLVVLFGSIFSLDAFILNRTTSLRRFLSYHADRKTSL